MKTIAFFDSENFDSLDSDFKYVVSHFVKKHSNIYNFLIFNQYHFSNISDFTSINKKSEVKINVKHVTLPKYASKIFFYIYILLYSDLIFIKGRGLAWSFPIFKLLFWKKIILVYNKPISETANRFLFTKWITRGKEFLAVKFSDQVITNYEYVREYLSVKYSIQSNYIENGGNHTERVESTIMDHVSYPFLKYMYSVCEITNDKSGNIELVLDAFTKIKNKYLVVIANWEQSKTNLNLKNKYSNYSNIFLMSSIYDKRIKDLILSNSVLSIHTSSNACSSFISESMSLKLPVFAFENINYKFLTEGKAAYFRNSNDVIQFIEKLSIEKLRHNAHSMFEIANSRFRWENIIDNYFEIVDQLLLNKESSSFSISSKNASISNPDLKFKPSYLLLNAFYNLFL